MTGPWLIAQPLFLLFQVMQKREARIEDRVSPPLSQFDPESKGHKVVSNTQLACSNSCKKCICKLFTNGAICILAYVSGGYG